MCPASGPRDDPDVTDKEILYRGLRADQHEDGQASARAFIPRKRDKRHSRISVFRALFITPQKVFEGPLPESVALARVTALDARSNGAGIQLIDMKKPAHAGITLPHSQPKKRWEETWKVLSRKLAQAANNRPCIWKSGSLDAPGINEG